MDNSNFHRVITPPNLNITRPRVMTKETHNKTQNIKTFFWPKNSAIHFPFSKHSFFFYIIYYFIF